MSVDWRLLKKVSRSFYLTLRLLPAPVRESISLAYLLARLTDTKADGAVSDGERELLKREPDLIADLARSPDRTEIQDVWRTIQEGQDFDRVRFGGTNAPPLTNEERDRYTYLVAGCVGEFWTRICAKRMPHFSWLGVDEMTSLGIEYGKGLQLINILRDRAADRALGRVYVAEEQVPVSLDEARRCLLSAEKYARALTVRRLRIATALPFMIGRETLDLLEHTPSVRVKVSRGRVWVILLRSLFY